MADERTSQDWENDEFPIGADATPEEFLDLPGEMLAGELPRPGDHDSDLIDEGLVDEGLVDEDAPDYVIVADETEAEELAEPVVDDITADEADPEDMVIDDPEQLDAATEVAAVAKSSRPVKRNQTVAPIRKDRPTAKRDQDRTTTAKRTTPTAFVQQSVGELKKVVWPSGEQVSQHFIVVLVFVIFIMATVTVLDTFFGWILIKLFG